MASLTGILLLLLLVLVMVSVLFATHILWLKCVDITAIFSEIWPGLFGIYVIACLFINVMPNSHITSDTDTLLRTVIIGRSYT